MKAVLLASGRSLRAKPIPDKNFLKFFGRPLIARQLDGLAQAGFNEILIVGGKHNLGALRAMVRKISGEKAFKKVKIGVREQKDLSLGMAGAIISAESWIGRDPFLAVSSNDAVEESAYKLVYEKIAPAHTSASKSADMPARRPARSRAGQSARNEGLLLAYKVEKYFPGGYLKVGAGNKIIKIVEKPRPGKEPSKLVNIVVHYHPQPGVFLQALKNELKVKNGNDDIYERALQRIFFTGSGAGGRGSSASSGAGAGDRGSSADKVIYRAVPFSGMWQPIKYPWDVLELMHYFIDGIEKHFPRGRIGGRKAYVAKTATITGKNVYLEDGVRILDNAVVVGPAHIGANTIIATNALVRESHIGERCVIGFGTEVARSYVGDDVWTHTNYIGDSVIGNDVSFGAGTVTGNLRLDEETIKVNITKNWNGEKNEESVDSGLTKLGLITGDHIRVGINTSFMPGIKVGSNTFVGAGITIAEDIPDNSFVRGKWVLKVSPNRETLPESLRSKRFRKLL